MIFILRSFLLYADDSKAPMTFSASSYGVDWTQDGEPYLHVVIQAEVNSMPQTQLRLEEGVSFDLSFADAARAGNPVNREPAQIIIDLTK